METTETTKYDPAIIQQFADELYANASETRNELLLRVMEPLVDLTVSASGSLPPICRHYTLHGCPANEVSAKQPTGRKENLCEGSAASQKADQGKHESYPKS